MKDKIKQLMLECVKGALTCFILIILMCMLMAICVSIGNIFSRKEEQRISTLERSHADMYEEVAKNKRRQLDMIEYGDCGRCHAPKERAGQDYYYEVEVER